MEMQGNLRVVVAVVVVAHVAAAVHVVLVGASIDVAAREREPH